LKTGLHPRQVQIWFQNTRRHEKQNGAVHNVKEERMKKKYLDVLPDVPIFAGLI
jgi:hypothetical protein